MTRYMFRGVLSGVDPAAWVASHPRLRGFRDRIADSLQGTPEVRRRRAQTMVERLLVAALDDLGTHYVDGLGRHIDEIVRIRTELSRRYEMVLGLQASTVIPADLSPAAFEGLFNELDTHMTALDGATPGRHLRDTPPAEILTPHVNEVADDIQRGVTPDVDGRHRDPSIEPEIDLDPDPSVEIDRRSGRARRAEESRAARAAWRERNAALPEDPAWRAHSLRQAQDLLGLDDSWGLGLQRVGPYSEPLRAQLERLGDLDPTFLGSGYEISIRPPGGRWSRPDGVEIVSRQPRRYLFREHKEPQATMDRAWFSSPDGRRAIRDDLVNDAHIARMLQDKGCQGWTYSTGQPWLDDIFAAEIGALKREQPDLGRFLTLASAGSP